MVKKIEGKQATPEDLQQLHNRLSELLGQASDLFVRPEECKLTLVVRQPWLPEGGVLISAEEDIQDAIDEILRLSKDGHITNSKV